MAFVIQLESDTFIDLINKAIEKDHEDKLWEKWLVDITLMDDKSFIPFDDYKQRHFKREVKRTDEEVLQDAENILKSMSQQ